MKRTSYLILLLLAIPFTLSTAFAQSHVIFDVEMSPGVDFTHPILGGTYYKANTDVYIDILLGNDGDAKNLAHQIALVFYANIDGVKTDGVPFDWIPVDPPFISTYKDYFTTIDSSWYLNAIGAEPITANLFATSIMTLLDTVVVRPGWDDGFLPDTMAYAGASQSGLPITGLLPRLRFHFNVPAGGSDIVEICVDSTGYPAEDQYDWQFDNDADFGGPYCFTFAPVPDMTVDTEYLHFEADFEDILPDEQIITIQNIGEQDHLDWTAQKSSSWLSVIPPSGTMLNDPVVIQVAPITSSMPAGIYYDTIKIVAPDAGNSPLSIAVEYEIMNQPPIISLSSKNFIFNAVAGSSNPSDQILSVSNIGVNDLNWTASNSETWLSINPVSGFNAGDITLSVDITGLPYGIYSDYVVVSDPNANNSPQKAHVQLEVSSDLPIIKIDSTHIFVICNVDFAPDRKFNITNDGAGTMNYYLTESSKYIMSALPNSGSVPQEITVALKTIGVPGNDVYDTVWVYSDEAINSPQFVEFHFHFTDDPAVIGVDKSSFSEELYECGQGAGLRRGDPIPPSILNIDDYGGGEPFNFNISHTEDWLTLDKTAGHAPSSISLTYEYQELAPGIYYDTLHISAINAINSPVRVPVTLTILETPETPEIAISSDDLPVFEFVTQINKYGSGIGMDIDNNNPGCMDWSIENMPTWLLPKMVLGSAYPWQFWLRPSGYGMTRGIYYDEIRVESSTASNSPYIIACQLSVFKFYGDNNFDGKITILDVVYLLKYLYKDGQPPQPVAEIADCNCDGEIDILDAVAIINYLYKDYPPLCGNPY